jgi:hypothetical protein
LAGKKSAQIPPKSYLETTPPKQNEKKTPEARKFIKKTLIPIDA